MVAQETQNPKQRPAMFWSTRFFQADYVSNGHAQCPADSQTCNLFRLVSFDPERLVSFIRCRERRCRLAEPIIFDVRSGKRIDVKTAPLEIQFQGGPGFDWFPDSKGFYYDHSERGEKTIELRTVDAETGELEVVIREKSDRYVDPGETFSRFLHDSAEVLWSSERRRLESFVSL